MNKISATYSWCLLLLILIFSYTSDASSDDLNSDNYLQKRQELITRANLKSFESALVLSPKEEIVNRRLNNLKKRVYKECNLDIEPKSKLREDPEKVFWPAQPFFKVRDKISSDKDYGELFRFIQAMPKGSILHIHPSAMGNFSWMVEKYLNSSNAYYLSGGIDFSDYSLTDKCMFKISKQNPGVNWSRLADHKFDHVKLKSAILKRLIINDSNYYTPHNWPLFENIFSSFWGIFDSDEICYPYNYNAIYEMLEKDHVSHIEFRCGVAQNPRIPEELKSEYRPLVEELGYTTVDFYNIVCREASRNVENKDGYGITFKIIYSNSRHPSPPVNSDTGFQSYIAEKLKICAGYIRKYPDYVVGYDIYGEEDTGYQTLAFYQEFLKAKQDCPEMEYFFHNGESKWFANDSINSSEYHISNDSITYGRKSALLPYNNNLYDSYLLGCKRIGHGISLIKTPGLIELFKEKDICFEINPISNQLLQYVADQRNHPAKTFLELGLPVVLSPDDPAIFGYVGVSYDFWIACMAWNLDLRGLKQLALNSIKYASLNEDERAALLRHFNSTWSDFIDEQVIAAEMDSVIQ